MEQNFLSEGKERQILSEVVTCFDHAKEDREAIFRCMNLYSRKFAQMSFNSSQKVSKFAIQGLRITTILFQEASCPQEPLGKDFNELDPDDKISYRYEMKKALICP